MVESGRGGEGVDLFPRFFRLSAPLAIKFTADISDSETVFLDTVIYKGNRFKEQSILDIKTHFKPTETFQYTHFTSCHPPSVRNGFVNGECLRILGTNSSKATFDENISNFKKHLLDRGYPQNLIDRILSEIKFTGRTTALKQSNKERKEILPFVTQYQPSISILKEALLKNWHLIQNQALLRQIFKQPPIFSYKKGKSLRKGNKICFTPVGNVRPVTPCVITL